MLKDCQDFQSLRALRMNFDLINKLELAISLCTEKDLYHDKANSSYLEQVEELIKRSSSLMLQRWVISTLKYKKSLKLYETISLETCSYSLNRIKLYELKLMK